MTARITLPGRTVDVHGGSRGATLTVTVDGRPSEYLTLPDLASIDALTAALGRARTQIVMRAVAETAR